MKALALGLFIFLLPSLGSAQAPERGVGAVISWRDLPSTRVVRQSRDFSCGSAAIADLLRFHFDDVIDEDTVFDAMVRGGEPAQIRQNGFSLLDMQKFLRARGYDGHGYRYEPKDLAALGAPAIALINTGGFRHFVVIKGVRAGRILVGDPAAGMRMYKLEDFIAVWSRIVFVVRRSGDAGHFNAPADWAIAPQAPTTQVIARSVDDLTRDLPPLYQISPVRNP